jgi:hypothetical protein
MISAREQRVDGQHFSADGTVRASDRAKFVPHLTAI